MRMRTRCACKTRRARACFSFASRRRNSRKPIYLSQILAPLSGWSQQNKQNAKQPSGKKPACFISFDSGRRLARTEEKSPFPLLVLTNQLSKTDQLGRAPLNRALPLSRHTERTPSPTHTPGLQRSAPSPARQTGNRKPPPRAGPPGRRRPCGRPARASALAAPRARLSILCRVKN